MTARPLLAAVTALLFVTAGCLAGTQTAPETTASTISVSAAGEVSAPPDLAVVRVAVVATADTADAARGDAATDVDRARAALGELDLPDGAVTTAYFAVSPEYDDKGREIVGYRAIHALEIEAPVDDEAGVVVDAAVGAGADSVDGVTFTLRDETRRELRADALDAAMASARADADAVAATEDLTITGVRSISMSGDDVPFFARAEAADAADGRTSFDPGPVTVTARVDVTYTIE